MGLNAAHLANTFVRQNQIEGEYQRMESPTRKTGDKADLKGKAIWLAKQMLKAAGEMVVDRLVGLGMAIGGLRVEDAPAAKAFIKNSAVKTFRYLYIDGPKRMADHCIEDVKDARLRQLLWQASYRLTQAAAIFNPLIVPTYEALIGGGEKLAHFALAKTRGESKAHAA
jgi:hypothetical protein